MNDHIRQAVLEKIEDSGKNKSEIARAAGVDRQYLRMMLNGEKGSIPVKWVALLKALNLTLTVTPKDHAPNPSEAER